jgi:AhpD family alkylhydroperoxidase
MGRMTLVREIEWEACLVEPRRDAQLEKRLRKQTGRVAGSVRYFSACPWLPEEINSMNACLGTSVFIEPRLADLAGLVVSQDNSCRYCYAAQRVLLRMLGFPETRISQIEQNFLTAELDPRERVALEFARRVSRSDPLPSAADKKALREAGFDEMAILELAGYVALLTFFNRISTLPALPPQHWEAFPDRWLMRVLRPLLAFRVRSYYKRGRSEKLRPEQKTGPYSYLVLALEGLPIAGELRRFLDALWQSSILSRRSKALVFAVVARALGCRRSEQESAALLLEEGVDGQQLEEILSHLASPVLDPVEAVIVPFARETVWYQAAPIQRRAREVREAIGIERFLEFTATAAIANTVCRLGLVADPC